MDKGLLQKERLAHLISVSGNLRLRGGIRLEKFELVNTGNLAPKASNFVIAFMMKFYTLTSCFFTA